MCQHIIFNLWPFKKCVHDSGLGLTFRSTQLTQFCIIFHEIKGKSKLAWQGIHRNSNQIKSSITLSTIKPWTWTKTFCIMSFRTSKHAQFIKLDAIKLQNHSIDFKQHDYELKSHGAWLEIRIQSWEFKPLRKNGSTVSFTPVAIQASIFNPYHLEKKMQEELAKTRKGDGRIKEKCRATSYGVFDFDWWNETQNLYTEACFSIYRASGGG